MAAISAADGLFERERERAALARLLDEAHGGRGGVAAIEAVAGAGKTSLLSLGEQLAQRRGLRVLRARGAEVARGVPLALLRALFERCLAELPDRDRARVEQGPAAALAGALGLADPQPLNDRQLHHGAYWLVANLARLKPLLLLVDDLQWADATSLTVLAAIGPLLDDLPVALVVAHRPSVDDVPPELAALSLGASVRLHPAPLTLDGVAAVLRAQLGERPIDERTGELAFEATGGNPFLVMQLAAAFAETDGPLDARELEDLANGVSRALSSLLRMRVGRLGPDAVALAHAVITLGDDCDIADACAVARLAREPALRAAGALATAGIFSRNRVTAFAHPLVRAAVAADLVAADRARLRERAVDVLLGAGADPSAVSEHLLETAPAGDGRAVSALRAAAAKAAAAAAPGHAAVLLRRAIVEVSGDAHPPALLDEVIAAELVAAEFEQAKQHIHERLARGVTPSERAELVRSLGRAVMQTEGVPAAVALLDGALDGLDAEGRLLVESEQAWMFMVYPPLAERLQAPMGAYAGLAGETPGERAMLAMVGVAMCLVPGVAARAVAPIVARAYGDGALFADGRLDTAYHAMTGWAMNLTEQFDLTEREMTLAVDAARRGGSSSLGIALVMRGLGRLYVGRLGDGEADALAAIEWNASAPGAMNDFMGVTAVGIVVDARSERGDDAGATAVLRDNGLVGDLPADPQLRALMPRARAHLVAGRAAEALDDARRLAVGLEGFEDVMGHSAVVESLALSALGDGAAASEVAAAQLDRARVWGTPLIVATALRASGVARGGAAGQALLEEAVALLDASPARMEHSRCMLALGMLLRRRGQRTAALDMLRRTADLAQRLGGRRVAEDALGELRILGARPRRLAFSGADSLTAAELRVAQLAARGRSNREIAQELWVSLKTVEAHLGHTYTKLAIRSRRELGGALEAVHTGEPG